MKANELMIGDWVLINGTPRKVQSVDGVDDEIMADDELYILCQDRVHSEDEIQPIPLTAEILEKNGFEKGTYELPVSGKKIPKYSYAEVEGDIKEVVLLPLTMNFIWSFSAIDGTHIPVLQFVHQLQHALRPCGIDKEIEL